MANLLYTIVIYPLELVIEFIFSLSSSVIKDSPGAAIIAVSIGVTLLTLPLYAVAEKWQKKETDVQKKMKGQLQRIRQTFSGDERYMMQQAFYLENHYHPLMALRSSFSLLIMVPFFMAAYNFLSKLPALKGQSFLFVKDLSSPDALFCLSGHDINILPIAMTVINCIAGAIYSKGQGLREKIQIYGLALVFLVILYGSPSGLVLYWTMNNIFSLVKNIFYRMKNPLKVFYFCVFAVLCLAIVYVLFFHHGVFKRRMILSSCLCLPLFSPLFCKLAKYLARKPLVFLSKEKEGRKLRDAIFLLCCLCLCLLCGLVIPLGLVSSSVVEFFGIDNVGNPKIFVFQTFFQSIGFFLFWPCCIYFMFSQKTKVLLAVLCCSLCFCAVLNAFCFVGDYGTLTRMIFFSDGMKAQPAILVFLDIAVCIFAFFFVFFVAATKRANILSYVLLGFCICFLAMSFSYNHKVSKECSSLLNLSKKNAENLNEEKEDSVVPIFHLSKTKKNIIFLMLDRAESVYFPIALQKFENLKQSFKGFTYYTNALSFNEHTLIAAPALYGGYEYTPFEMQKAKEKTLQEKHDEALMLLPRIFSEQLDFDVLASDSSWAGYSWIPDMSIFDEYPKIKAYLLQGRYTSQWIRANKDKVQENVTSNCIRRNLLLFSFFRISPLAFHDAIYDDGSWWQANEVQQDMQDFLAFYSILDFLPSLTDFSCQNNTYFAITNEATHKSVELQPPEYEPVTHIDRSNENQIYYSGSICTFFATMKKVGKWLDYLKQNDCYSNTRIIIAADHGIGMNDRLVGLSPLSFPYQRDHLHPLLLFKDFGQEGELKEDDTFMTTADVPFLATKDIAKNLYNPFTKKPLEQNGQKDVVWVTTTQSWSPGQHKKNTFNIKENEWVKVKGDFFSPNAWEQESPFATLDMKD